MNIELVGKNSMLSSAPHLWHEWDFERNEDDIYSITKKSGKKAWWICNVNPNHKWEAVVHTRTSGSKCPFCSGRKAFKGETDMWTTNPHMAKELKNSEDGHKYMQSSGKLMSWKCTNCKHEYHTSPNQYRGCPACATEGKTLTSKGFEYALSMWNRNKNSANPSDIIAGSHKKAWWICDKGHEWVASIRTIAKDRLGCPYCSNKRVLRGFNDLWTTHPEIAKHLKRSEEGYRLVRMSNKIVEWLCFLCGKDVKERALCDVETVYCPRCSDGFSYPEKFVYNTLLSIGEEPVWEKSFSWSQGKRYDFYLSARSAIIEIHGEQHYKKPFYQSDPSLSEKELKIIQDNDQLKKDLALKNGIEKYIVIDARQTNFSYLSKSVKSELVAINELIKEVDFVDVAQKSQISIKEKTLEKWNEGRDAKEISSALGIDVSTVNKYLRDLESQGLCTYNSGKRNKVIGVNFDKRRNRWAARINIRKKGIHLGFYEEYDDAVRARKQAEIDYNFKNVKKSSEK